MINLSAYPKFEKDIQGKNTNIYPLLVFDEEQIESENGNFLAASTIKETMLTENEGNIVNFHDYGLKISNIKQSIDIDKRTFKISNLSITFNNYLVEGSRLSDTLSNYVNREVSVYYKTQSCKYLADCMPVYKGFFKSFKFTDTKISLILEDKTQSKFHKDVPISNLGVSSRIYNDDYKNAYLPILYGEVTKAPAIAYKTDDSMESSLYLLVDNVIGFNEDSELNRIEIAGFGRNETTSGIRKENNLYGNFDNPLYIYKDVYYNVLDKFSNIGGEFFSYPLSSQYDVGSNYITIPKMYDFKEPKNPPAYNELLCAKVTIANDMKLLLGDEEILGDGTTRYTSTDDTGKTIVDLNPIIFNENGSIDTSDFTDDLILTSENFLNTFAQIPIQDSSEINTETNFPLVNEISTDVLYWSFEDAHPDGDYWRHYQNLVINWCTVHADQLVGTEENNFNDGMKLIEMPCADLIRQKLEQRMNEWGWKIDANVDITSSTGNVFCAQPLAGAIPLSYWVAGNDLDMDAHEEMLRVEMISPSPGVEVSNYDPVDIYDSYYYFKNNDGSPLSYRTYALEGHLETAVTSWYYSSYGGEQQWLPSGWTTYHFDCRNVLRDSYYPSSMYVFGGAAEVYGAYLNQDNFNTENFNQSTIWVGQKSSFVGNADSAAIQASARFINVFDDGSGTPYLWENADEFCQFYPTNLIDVNPEGDFIEGGTVQQNHATMYLHPKWNGRWNGVSVGALNNTTNGSSCIQHSEYMYPRTLNIWGSHLAKDYCDKSADTNPKQGGKSWALYFPSGYESGQILQNRHGAGYVGDLDPGANVKMKPHTFIPCGWGGGSSTYFAWKGYDFMLSDNPNFMNLTAETEEVAASRFTLGFTLSDLGGTDAVHTVTYPYAKSNCVFDSVIDGQTNANDEFRLRLSASDYNAGQVDDEGNPLEFQFDNEFAGVNLIKQQGGGILVSSGEKSFDCTLDNSTNNVFSWEDGSNYKIENWNTPEHFNALVLTYMIESDDIGTNSVARVMSKINSVGVMQFSIIENALDDKFYIDSFGRANTTDDIIIEDDIEKFKFIDEEYNGSTYKKLISNPADIMYHFLEKELELVDSMDRDSWKDARQINSNINLGFSVQEEINSKKLIEDISRNTQLFPRFNHDGTFGFMNIKLAYTDNDAKLLSSEDVIKLSIDRTPISNIKTLVNVKYRKDYEEDNYTRQTGYVDGYDLFGNGDGFDGQSGLESGYKYSFYNIGRTDNVLEFESDYIRDRASAEYLRNFIYLNSCNQHTIMKVRFPIKYSYLEAGDVIRFDSIINETKAFGEDYTSPDVYRNGQKIYPYFIIKSITKSTKHVDIEVYQLHQLQRTFSAGKGSLKIYLFWKLIYMIIIIILHQNKREMQI